ncbi:MarR family transcriptional regulator [Agromyces mediolanus]|uniref:MarR family winged helix-turn-helix transcriptional regulator n=1 Tax=Agromyces mediolanus TaxID=41986 RepID=UPI0038373E0F
MVDSSSSRARAIAEHAEAMRGFMAHAVLFQDAVARSAGLNGTDLQALGLLLSEGPATPGELAQRTGLTAGGAITTMLDRLERSGFVTRSRDEADRRRVLVAALPEAIFAAVGPVYGGVADRWNDYLDTLSEEQIRFATEFLERAAAFNRDETERLRREPRARS